MVKKLKIFVMTCKKKVGEYGEEIMRKVLDCLEIDEEIIKLMLVYQYDRVILKRDEIDLYINKIKRSEIESDGMI